MSATRETTRPRAGRYITGSSRRIGNAARHAGRSGNTSVKWSSNGGSSAIATASPQKKIQSSLSKGPLKENVNTPKNATHNQKKCSVAWSHGRLSRTDAPTSSVKSPTPAST